MRKSRARDEDIACNRPAESSLPASTYFSETGCVGRSRRRCQATTYCCVVSARIMACLYWLRVRRRLMCSSSASKRKRGVSNERRGDATRLRVRRTQPLTGFSTKSCCTQTTKKGKERASNPNWYSQHSHSYLVQADRRYQNQEICTHQGWSRAELKGSECKSLQQAEHVYPSLSECTIHDGIQKDLG